MEPSAAIRLIVKGVERHAHGQVWCDLGAGSGVFTQALSEVLGKESKVTAVDRDASALSKIITPKNGATVSLVEADFLQFPFGHDTFDGFLMANSLHFVRDKQAFLMKLRGFLKSNGRLIIIEYDMSNHNPWVPFPITFAHLSELTHQTGYSSISKLEEHPSLYHRASMYSALIKC